MSFPLLISAFSVFAGWAVLSLIGGERSRRLSEIETEKAAAEAAASAPAPAAPPASAPSKPAARQSGH